MTDTFSGVARFHSNCDTGDGNLAARGDKWKIGQGTTVKVDSPRRPENVGTQNT